MLDLDDDGLDIVGIDVSDAFFDLNENGFAEKTAWIGPDDAFLARDVNGNGRIDDLSELFGGQMQDGFTTLAAFDTNDDDVINAEDTIFANLLLWKDVDGDGLTDQGELVTLAGQGITNIRLDATFTNKWVGGNWISHESTYEGSAGTRSIFDVWFENDQVRTVYAYGDTVTYPDDIARLPDLVGYGIVKSLHATMAEDAVLRADLESFVRSAFGKGYHELATASEALLLRWADAAGVSPNSRGSYIDARHLVFLEAIHGQAFVADGGGANPGKTAGAALEAYYDSVVGAMTARPRSTAVLGVSDLARRRFHRTV